MKTLPLRILALVLLFNMLLPFKSFARWGDLYFGLTSGMSFGSFSNSFYPKSSGLTSNLFFGIEGEAGINRLQAVSLGILYANKGMNFQQVADISYSSWEIPIAFIQYLPLTPNIQLNFRAILTPVFVSKNKEFAPLKKNFVSAGFGIGIHYEFIPNLKLFARGELLSSISSVSKTTNNYLRSDSKFGEGRMLFGVLYNLNPDLLKKKVQAIPECLK